MLLKFCSTPETDTLKSVIDEVDALHSSDNNEDKHKIHRILEKGLQKVCCHCFVNTPSIA